MIDYADIGTRIRQARLARGVTQEQLAEACDIGIAHVSHLERGHTIPSLKVFIAIVNYLDCSADVLLCREIRSARPILKSWLSQLVEDCDPAETKIIGDTVVALKDTLRKNRPSED